VIVLPLGSRFNLARKQTPTFFKFIATQLPH
jgi:hypothetical protein